MSEQIWKHSGDSGDIIASLPAIRAAGGGKLILYHGGECREPWSQKRTDNLAPLLLRQPYITGVEWSSSRDHNHKLNNFRDVLRKWPGETLADAHLLCLGLSPLERNKKWIDVDPIAPPYPVILARSPRYHNPNFPWARVLDTYRGQCCFVGHPAEHQDFVGKFGNVPFLPTENLLIVAQYIAGSKLFIGNQSAPLNIAQGLHHPLVMEVAPNAVDNNCIYDRMNAIYGRNEWIALPEIEGHRVDQVIYEEPVEVISKTEAPKLPISDKLAPVRSIPHPPLTKFSQIAFLSLVHDVEQNCYHSAYREFTPKKSDKESMVRYQKYDSDFNLIGESRLLMDRGEDPRAFKFNGKYYCSLIVYVGGDWKQLVIDMLTGESHQLKNRFQYAGKNWVPVPSPDGLYMIRSLQPLSVVKVDENWNCTSIIQPTHPRDIGEYRGGGAAHMEDGKIKGIGHRTLFHPLRHIPFTYEIDLEQKTVKTADLEVCGISDELVIDPTGELEEGIVCSCAQTSWWDEQIIRTRILR